MNHLSNDHVGSGKALYSCYWEGCDRCVEMSDTGVEGAALEGKRGNGKAFVQRQKIMRHLQTHTGTLIPYSQLEPVLILCGTGDRPFVCDICQKGFSEKTTLTVHQRMHTNEKSTHCADSSNLGKGKRKVDV